VAVLAVVVGAGMADMAAVATVEMAALDPGMVRHRAGEWGRDQLLRSLLLLLLLLMLLILQLNQNSKWLSFLGYSNNGRNYFKGNGYNGNVYYGNGYNGNGNNGNGYNGNGYNRNGYNRNGYYGNGGTRGGGSGGRFRYFA
jgi:hypothetical protein